MNLNVAQNGKPLNSEYWMIQKKILIYLGKDDQRPADLSIMFTNY